MTPSATDKEKLATFLRALAAGDDFEKAADRIQWTVARARDELDTLADKVAPKKKEKPKRGTEPDQQERITNAGPVSAIVAHADGGSRGNPGPAAWAAVLYDPEGNELARRGECIGKATNNVAEYLGVVGALQLAKRLGAAKVSLRLDSELIVKQLNGAYKVKSEDLKPLYENVRALRAQFDRFDVSHVRRGDNAAADRAVNLMLDHLPIDS